MIYAVFRAGVRVLAWVILGRRLRIDGMERMPRRGSVLVIGNHVGTVEPALTGVFIPRRDVYYMAKSELFRTPLLAWLFRRNHAFPVVRDTADRAALRAALAVLADGHVLLVYPEGTRSWDGRIVGEVQAGAGFLARHSGALIVPVASWGSERVIPRGKWLPRPADVELRIGEPFHLPSRGRDGRPLTSREAAAIMMERVIALLPRERRPVGADMRTLGGSSPAA
jgi:1-acyl-sn-glycerol-3-phosphate acyltransferase